MKDELFMERFHGNGIKNLNSAVILKLIRPKKNLGLEDRIESLSWKFELNRTRNRFLKSNKIWEKNPECTVPRFFHPPFFTNWRWRRRWNVFARFLEKKLPSIMHVKSKRSFSLLKKMLDWWSRVHMKKKNHLPFATTFCFNCAICHMLG